VELSGLEPGEPVEEGGEGRPFRRGEVWFVDLTLQDAELMAQRQDFDVLVGGAHRQQPDEGEHVAVGSLGAMGAGGGPADDFLLDRSGSPGCWPGDPERCAVASDQESLTGVEISSLSAGSASRWSTIVATALKVIFPMATSSLVMV